MAAVSLWAGSTQLSCGTPGGPTTAVAAPEPAASTLQNLRAQSLDIVNEQGDVVVHLGVRSSGAGGLWLTDASGTRVLKINQDERGGLITILDAKGEGGGTLGISTAGALELHQPDGDP